MGLIPSTATAARPLVWFIILVLVILMHLVLVGMTWYILAQQEKHMKIASFASEDSYMRLLSNIKAGTAMLLPVKIPALGLRRVIESSLNGSWTSFSTIENQIGHILFVAFSIVPYISQTSYIEENDLMFSYYKESNQTFSLFSNGTFNSSSKSQYPKNYHWYRQLVNESTGELYGEAIEMPAVLLQNFRWNHQFLVDENGYAAKVVGTSEMMEPSFVYSVPMKRLIPHVGHGFVSLSVPIKVFVNFILNMDLQGGYLFSATKDGYPLIQTGPPNTIMAYGNDMLSITLDDGKVTEKEIRIPLEVNFSDINDILLLSPNVNIWGSRYKFYFTSIEIVGLHSVIILMVPSKGFLTQVHKQYKVALALMVLAFVFILLMSCYCLFLYLRATKREILLSAALIKQMEATQQAERKNINKSNAFASASHDVRTSLAAITSLIDLSLSSNPPQAEIRANLEQMSSCTSSLLGILNSVLDTSKIEAGKIQLEKKEFNLREVMEESIEFFYVVALKKDVDVMLDPCDGSYLKYSYVLGDCGRLKQILHNLLGNAVKFTSEGHVVVRAWVKKVTSKNPCLVLDRDRCFPSFSCFPHLKNDSLHNDFGSFHAREQNQSVIEFIVEVDDTGRGIPKEKRESVFENYVQVKQAGYEGQGTGLGLGIVQSLVRLMGGEIMIIDKAYGEKGSCFRFNVFLNLNEANDCNVVQEDNWFHFRQLNDNPCISKRITLRKGHNIEFLHAILLVEGKKGSLILQRWMRCHGIKVWPIYQLDDLHPTFDKIKSRMFNSHSSNYEKFDSTPLHSSLSDSMPHHVEKYDYSPSSIVAAKDPSKKASEANHILIIIDMGCNHISEIGLILSSLNKNTNDLLCKIVWIVDHRIPHVDLQRLVNESELVLRKPFHHSHLYAILHLFQEHGDVKEGHSNYSNMRNIMQGHWSSISLTQSKEIMHTSHQSSYHTQQRVAMEGDLSKNKPLSGLSILVVEDNDVLQRVTKAMLSNHGATIKCCDNGEVAVNLIRDALKEFSRLQDDTSSYQEECILSKKFSYDIVLMDCEMPLLNGYEATKKIREEELRYGIHIPIIALSAHALSEEATKSIQAGMDSHLVKPLKLEQLIDAIQSINHDT